MNLKVYQLLTLHNLYHKMVLFDLLPFFLKFYKIQIKYIFYYYFIKLKKLLLHH